ncbi:MAG: HDIG domain-containing metalloprotein [Desulfovibrionaceae bacterium]
MMTRDEAWSLLNAHNDETHLIHHALESEAVMRGLARRLGRDEELWGVVGLLHDLDYATTKDNPARHGLDCVPLLDGKLPEDAVRAITAHNGECTGLAPSTELDFALRCGESVTGLIHANALVRPDGMAGMAPKSLKKKMKEKAFAAGVDRDRVRECEKIGLELGDFFAVAIEAMDGVKTQVGLS